jgi:hypothetical protein
MKRAGSILLVLAVVAAAFFLGRWSREAPTLAAAAPMHDAADEARTSTEDATRPEAPSAATTPKAAASNRAPSGSGARPQLPNVPVSARASGPKPLEPEDLPRLDKAERIMGAEGGTTRDLLDLARDEPQDEQGRQLEALLGQSILRNGGNYTQLRLSPPRCTRSVCIIRGIGVGQTQNPRSAWQRLSGAVMSEPWFREAFDDMRVMVTGDGPDTVYITLYIRCAPGTCLHGRR